MKLKTTMWVGYPQLKEINNFFKKNGLKKQKPNHLCNLTGWARDNGLETEFLKFIGDNLPDLTK